MLGDERCEIKSSLSEIAKGDADHVDNLCFSAIFVLIICSLDPRPNIKHAQYYKISEK